MFKISCRTLLYVETCLYKLQWCSIYQKFCFNIFTFLTSRFTCMGTECPQASFHSVQHKQMAVYLHAANSTKDDISYDIPQMCIQKITKYEKFIYLEIFALWTYLRGFLVTFGIPRFIQTRNALFQRASDFLQQVLAVGSMLAPLLLLLFYPHF